jgi:hypothetical protein
MSIEEKHLFLSVPLDSGFRWLLKESDRNAALNFITNAVCYKTWTEMEANYYTRKPDNFDEWMFKVNLSAHPIKALDMTLLVSASDANERNQAEERFRSFCEIMEKEVAWVNEMVQESSQSLYDLISAAYFKYDDMETEMMFGPIEDDEPQAEDVSRLLSLTPKQLISESNKSIKKAKRLLERHPKWPP